MAPHVVLDTNVLVAALRSRLGASYKLLSLLGTGKYEIHISVPLVLEYEEVLQRFLEDLNLTGEDIGDFLDYVCAVGVPHEVFFLWRPFLRDPKDDMVLELAVVAGCTSIVTFNQRDFAGAEAFGIRARAPIALLREIGEVE
jgi:putative PIN family toxin of toxin-antitoxin system